MLMPGKKGRAFRPRASWPCIMHAVQVRREREREAKSGTDQLCRCCVRTLAACNCMRATAARPKSSPSSRSRDARATRKRTAASACIQGKRRERERESSFEVQSSALEKTKPDRNGRTTGEQAKHSCRRKMQQRLAIALASHRIVASVWCEFGLHPMPSIVSTTPRQFAMPLPFNYYYNNTPLLLYRSIDG